ncbi:hypothetical protein [Macrococcus equi]|uniref:hypothetical protein n=1 Tax=Macrococcus equi TaxID=3395462 RepID=UPI0039BDF8EF
MTFKEFINVLKPKRKLQKDVFDWYEEGVWKAEVIKCKQNKRTIYVNSYFCDEKEKFYIEYYNK